MSLEETYQFDEKTDKDEGQDAMDDIDAFEARMRGEVKAPAKPLQTRVRIPAVASTPSRADARDRTHVAGQQAKARRQAHEEGVRIRRKRRREGRACTPEVGPAHPCDTEAHLRACLPRTVKPAKMTDAQQDAEEAMSALSDLDKFDRQHAK